MEEKDDDIRRGDFNRLERKVDSLEQVTRENNSMLKRERAVRRLKYIVVVCVLVFGSGYALHLYSVYHAEIVLLKDRAQTAAEEVGKFINSARDLKNSLDSTQESVNAIFSSGDG